MKELLKIAISILGVTWIGFATAQSSEIARWVFDKPGATQIPSTNGKFNAQINNRSGNSGIMNEAGKTFFHSSGDAKDYITLGNGKELNLSDKFSLEAWFRPNISPAGSYTMIIGNKFCKQFQLDWTPNRGTIEFFVGGGDLVKNRAVKNGFNSGDWMHIVAVYDSTAESQNQFLYVNGELVNSIRNSSPCPRIYPGFLRIAQNSETDMKANVNADWKEVALYNSALSPSEVKSKFNEKKDKAMKIEDMSWQMPLNQELWKVTDNTGIGEKYIDRLSGISEQADSLQNRDFSKTMENGTLKLAVKGNPPERSGVSLTQKFSSGIDLSGFNYCLVTCSAKGLQRALPPIDVFTLAGKNKISILESGEIICDGIKRNYLIKLKLDSTISSATITTCTKNSFASLEISSIQFLKELPQGGGSAIFTKDWNSVENMASFKQVNIERLFNNSLKEVFNSNISRNEAVIEPLSSFHSDKVSAFGIPFLTGKSEKNLVTPQDTALKLNKQNVEVFGLDVKRAYFSPAGRNDVTEIAINDNASEIFMIFADNKPGARSKKRYGIPSLFWTIESIEGFSVALEYEDGSKEIAFPYSLMAKGYAIQGMVGVYGIPADKSRKLKKIALYNKISGATVSIAALTLNLADEKILPAELTREPELIPIPPIPKISGREPSLKARDGIIEISNAFYTAEFDCKNGFSIKKIVNKYSERNDISFAPESGLEVISGTVKLSGKDFETSNIIISGKTAQIHLKSKEQSLPLALTILLGADEGPQIIMNIEAKNTGNKTFCANIRFPFIKNLVIGDIKDTWGFFPQYRNVLTNKMFFCKQPNHRSFVMQFMDAFNPRLGSGISLLSHNIEQEPIQYCMSKNENGVTAYIENEGEDFQIEPGKLERFCERTIALHGGDWHQAAKIYASWVAGWYKPYRSQDKEWFKKATWMKAYCSSPALASSIYKIPKPIIDPVSKKHFVDDMIAVDEKYMGMKPQIIHFYCWAFSEKTGAPRWGDYSTKDYENFGGIEKFHAMLKYIEEKKKIPVSIYTIWDRCSTGTEAFKKFGESIATVRKGDVVRVSKDYMEVSTGVKAWKEHAVANLARLAKETGTNALYLDVFATDDRARSFAAGRGHAVPSHVASDDAEFLKAIREAVPAEVALWGEFPIPDVGSQYWDGFMNYSPLFLYEHLAEVFDSVESAPLDTDGNMLPPDIFRFLFPKIHNFCFPVGSEGYIDSWRCLKFILFNGISLYDTTWRIFPEDCLNNLAHTLKIMNEYIDCFSSEKPEMFVPALRDKIYSNMFPGEKRTVWTLFNSRYVTVKGKIIEVEHKQGAKYIDLWNGKKLDPEIAGGKAIISMELEPQQIGCIAQIEN